MKGRDPRRSSVDRRWLADPACGPKHPVWSSGSWSEASKKWTAPGQLKRALRSSGGALRAVHGWCGFCGLEWGPFTLEGRGKLLWMSNGFANME